MACYFYRKMLLTKEGEERFVKWYNNKK